MWGAEIGHIEQIERPTPDTGIEDDIRGEFPAQQRTVLETVGENARKATRMTSEPKKLGHVVRQDWVEDGDICNSGDRTMERSTVPMEHKNENDGKAFRRMRKPANQ